MSLTLSRIPTVLYAVVLHLIDTARCVFLDTSPALPLDAIDLSPLSGAIPALGSPDAERPCVRRNAGHVPNRTICSFPTCVSHLAATPFWGSASWTGRKNRETRGLQDSPWCAKPLVAGDFWSMTRIMVLVSRGGIIRLPVSASIFLLAGYQGAILPRDPSRRYPLSTPSRLGALPGRVEMISSDPVSSDSARSPCKTTSCTESSCAA